MIDPPRITQVGLSGLLIQFADRLEDRANRAALGLRAAIEAAALPGVTETAATLAAVYVRTDPLQGDPAEITERLRALVAARDWTGSALPPDRRLWRVPCAFGGADGPQLAQAARMAGRTADEAVADLCRAPLRVLTLGFSPGQPYLGILPARWDIPRQSGLTASVPVGALVVAVRQAILFTAETPTGWHHVGMTGFRGFQPAADRPILLRSGDEIALHPVASEALAGAEITCAPL